MVYGSQRTNDADIYRLNFLCSILYILPIAGIILVQRNILLPLLYHTSIITIQILDHQGVRKIAISNHLLSWNMYWVIRNANSMKIANTNVLDNDTEYLWLPLLIYDLTCMSGSINLSQRYGFNTSLLGWNIFFLFIPSFSRYTYHQQ